MYEKINNMLVQRREIRNAIFSMKMPKNCIINPHSWNYELVFFFFFQSRCKVLKEK